jgi:adenylate cyclase
MAAGLEQRDLIKDTFGKFVDPKIVSHCWTIRTSALGGERRVQTVLFADIENFTTLSEKLSPETCSAFQRLLEDAADLVAETKGIIDKFIGDGVVAFWGPPLEEHHAAAACRAASGFRYVAPRRTMSCVASCRSALRVRVGIATGELLVGNIGFQSKYNYTVRWAIVANLASRLEGVNKLYGTQILVSPRTVVEAERWGSSRARSTTVRVIGRREPGRTVRSARENDRRTAGWRGGATRSRAALALYAKRQWEEARIRVSSGSKRSSCRCARRALRGCFRSTTPARRWGRGVESGSEMTHPSGPSVAHAKCARFNQ